MSLTLVKIGEKFRECTLNPNYLVFDHGQIYSKYSKKFLSPSSSNGYLAVGFPTLDGNKLHRIHRLVAIHFIENPFNYDVVDHIDGNRQNNNVSNLRWVTHKENTANAAKNGVKSGNIKNVYIYNENMETIGLFPSISEAARQTGISDRTIYKGNKTGQRVESKGKFYFCKYVDISKVILPPPDGKYIPRYEDNYLVTQEGLIYSKFKQNFLNLETSPDGYQRITLKCKDKKEHFSIHRLVAELFIPMTDLRQNQVNHKDGNKLNNKVSNLEWVNASENGLHRFTLYPELCRSVEQLNPETLEVIASYKSITEAANSVGLHKSTVSNCVRGIKNTAGGFKWKYTDNI